MFVSNVGKLKPLQILDFLPQRHGQKRPNSVHIRFSLSTFNVGNDPYSCPKIANDTHHFSQPTSSMPLGTRSAIWDPGGPHQTPQTAIHTPKVTQFSLYTFNGKDPSSCPKIAKDTHLFFSTHFIHVMGA